MKIIELSINDPSSPLGRVSYIVGSKDVLRIVEHCPLGEGDKWFYDIYIADGRMIREFEPVSVIFSSEAGE